MLEELRSLIGTFQRADNTLEDAMFRHGQQLNLTPELVRQLAEAMKAGGRPGGRNPQDVVVEIIQRERPERPNATAKS